VAVILIIKLIFGGICAAMRVVEGPQRVAWFFIGFLLDLIGLIIVLVMSDLAAESAVRAMSADRASWSLRQE
jgi:hypothetical protein